MKMRKKLIVYVLSTLIITLVIVTLLFSGIINYENEQKVKNDLKLNNKLIANLINTNNLVNTKEFFTNNIGATNIRVTLINDKGAVLYDTYDDPLKMDNHNSRPEVVQARKTGEGYSSRYSNTLFVNTIYYATKLNNNYVLRTSMTLKKITGLNEKYLKYYIIAVFLTILLDVWLSLKLAYIIVKPIMDLQLTTSRVAKGELDRRVKIISKDEIGQLGKTFNYMADKLQSTIKDGLEKQNRLEAILSSMDSGVIAVDKDLKVIMINPYAERIFGVQNDIIGKNLLLGIRDFELENIIRNNEKNYKEFKILWPQERTLRVKTAEIISDKEIIGTVAVVQDITDLRKLENMRSQFVANVSHELKTPLTSIKGFAETLKYVEDPEKKDKFLNIIDEEVERLTSLINDILILSDIEQHKELINEQFDVDEVLDNVIFLIKNTAENRNIELTVEGSKLPKLYGDMDKFKQMLLNLVDNAVKYSEEKGKVLISKKFENNKIILWIEDNGIGMEEKHLDRIFERFYRVDKARSRAKGGTGLGLAIVKHIVMNFNGNISVESKLGKGTKFIVTIPVNKHS